MRWRRLPEVGRHCPDDPSDTRLSNRQRFQGVHALPGPATVVAYVSSWYWLCGKPIPTSLRFVSCSWPGWGHPPWLASYEPAEPVRWLQIPHQTRCNVLCRSNESHIQPEINIWWTKYTRDFFKTRFKVQQLCTALLFCYSSLELQDYWYLTYLIRKFVHIWINVALRQILGPGMLARSCDMINAEWFKNVSHGPRGKKSLKHRSFFEDHWKTSTANEDSLESWISN